ncbi:uncharacterized protein LOC125241290 [Leguminivora glycinivorella]|uniref:uncharacterized protein LOC125241290 n=1 Tax=Leguminivora glycinivorella TaxID=1035111 RepID=UPI00200BD0F0|nr:uncharacterized protein LOC125241290 [Leguminivora glycinivorella]
MSTSICHYLKMAAASVPSGLRPRKALADIEIEDVLNDSEFDYSGDDSDDDPMFLPLEIEKHASIESESSSSSDEEENVPDPPVTPPLSYSDVSELATTSSSSRGRARSSSKARSRGRGRNRGRGRGRGRTMRKRNHRLPFRQGLLLPVFRIIGRKNIFNLK